MGSEMKLLALGVVVVVAAGLVILLRHNLALRKAAREKEEAAKALPDDQVQCFSCGMVVPRDKALEKKGRYFCGVKRNDRHGNPIVPAGDRDSG